MGLLAAGVQAMDDPRITRVHGDGATDSNGETG